MPEKTCAAVWGLPLSACKKRALTSLGRGSYVILNMNKESSDEPFQRAQRDRFRSAN